MALQLSPAVESDADRIAEIHMAAFSTNAMLLAQFPTPAIRMELEKCIAKKALDDMQDTKVSVLVVRFEDKIISFAKWSLPILESENYTEPSWTWPEGTEFDVVKEWGEKVESAQQKALGSEPCYHLSFIATDPQYERRGAALMLMNWALDRCKEENVPAYLESTMDAGPLYRRLGFEPAQKISMVLKGLGVDGAPLLYEEACFLFRP